MLSSARRYMADRISPKENDTPVSNSSSFRRPKFKFANAFSRRKNRSSPASQQQQLQQKQPRRHFKKQDSPLSPEALVMAIKSVTSCHGNDAKKGIDFTPMSPMGEKKLKMMPKIAEYRGKGYLNAAQERELYAKLEQPKENPFDSSTVNEVGRKLEEYKRLSFVHRTKEHQHHDHHHHDLHDTDTRMSKLPAGTKNNNKSFLTDLLKKDDQILAYNTTTAMITKAHHIKEDEWTCEDERHYNELPLNDRVILDVKQVYDQAEEDFTQSLFVEMCFFARLGFIQPPICLRCLYMESMEGMDEDLDCTNYVIWRRNANILLHPETLEHNLCLVECQAARRLVDGQEVQNHLWDSIKQKLVYIEPGRLSVA